MGWWHLFLSVPFRNGGKPAGGMAKPHTYLIGNHSHRVHGLAILSNTGGQACLNAIVLKAILRLISIKLPGEFITPW